MIYDLHYTFFIFVFFCSLFLINNKNMSLKKRISYRRHTEGFPKESHSEI
jgi:hypothetical protein